MNCSDGAAIRPRGCLKAWIRRTFTLCIIAAAATGWGGQVRWADASDYTSVLRQLEPGDTLRLRAGIYLQTLPIHHLDGRPDAPIIIEGAGKDERTVFYAHKGRNTISLLDSSYIVIRNIEIDGRGLDMDGVKAEGNSRYAHHITLENLYMHDLGHDQQTVGISTKCPAWNWIVRRNRISGAGTGMYFGSSDGNVAFVNGLIEENTVVDSIGYDLQIKHLVAHPDEVEGFPTGRTQTVIRRNIFSKPTERETHDGVRPNVLIGHAPLTGDGVDDWVLVYDNVFYQNADEALFQGEGNIALYNNLFYNTHRTDSPAVVIQPHNCIPRKIEVFHNTVVTPGAGIVVRGGSPLYEQRVEGNVVFAGTPIRAKLQIDNLTGDYRQAGEFLVQTAAGSSCLDLRPLPDKRSAFRADDATVPAFEGAERDFAGFRRHSPIRGALAASDTAQSSRVCLPTGKDQGLRTSIVNSGR